MNYVQENNSSVYGEQELASPADVRSFGKDAPIILSDKVAGIDKSSAKSGMVSGLASAGRVEVLSGGLDLAHTA